MSGEKLEEKEVRRAKKFCAIELDKPNKSSNVKKNWEKVYS